MICYLMFGSLFNRGWSDAYAAFANDGVATENIVAARTGKNDLILNFICTPFKYFLKILAKKII